MIKRIEQWLIALIQGVLAKVTEELRDELAAVRAELKEHAVANAKDVQTHVEGVADKLFESIRAHAEEAVHADRAHVEAVVEDIHHHVYADYEDLKKHIYDEILKRYDTLVRDAAAAARVMDASKIAMAICDYCHLPNRRFSTSRIDGKVVCANCVAKGQN